MLIALKLTLVPLVVILASVIARRFGTRAGGVVTGLPFTAGPVSAFLALENGRAFAADAALAMLLSLVAIAAYATVFASASRRFGWPLAVALAYAAHLAVTYALAMPRVGLATAAVLAFGAVLVALLVVRAPAAGSDLARTERVWELPLRIVTATTIVIAITLAADVIGPRVSGLLATLPVIASVLAVSAYISGGRDEGMISVRGHLIGSLSLGMFFLIVAATIAWLSPVLAYLLAIAAAIGVNRLAALAERSARATPHRRATPTANGITETGP